MLLSLLRVFLRLLCDPVKAHCDFSLPCLSHDRLCHTLRALGFLSAVLV